MKFFLIFAILNISVHAYTCFLPNNLQPFTDDMVDAINDSNSTWKAGRNFNDSTSIQIDKLVVTEQENYFERFPFEIYPEGMQELPKSFDARQAWPNCSSIGKIYDQTKGYPAWVYVAVGSVADRICIQTGFQIDVESTIERIMNSTGVINTANIGQFFKNWSKNGIYAVESSKSCNHTSNECENETQLQHFNVTVRSPFYCEDKMRDLLINGPKPVYLQVHADFPSYKSGVYRIHTRRVLGMHLVKIIGFGTENHTDYWLATNSWGSVWGDNGTFKIERCGLEFGETPEEPSATFTFAGNGAIGSVSQDQLFDLV